MSVETAGDRPVTLIPEPEFEIVDAAHVAFAAAPTLGFTGLIHEPNGIDIQSIALTAQVMIEPAQRGYDLATRERLAELFGPPASWAPSTSGLLLARVTITVPAFVDHTRFSLEVPCTYDLEVAAAKYFYALSDGQVPLTFHFNGNVFYWARDAALAGRLQVVPVSWSTSAQYRMPLDRWRAMIDEHYPGGGWIRIGGDTLRRLNDLRAARGLASLDACVEDLLRQAG